MADELLWAMTAAGNAIAIWKGRSISASRRGAAPACAGARDPYGAVLGTASMSASNCGAVIWSWSSMSSSNPGGGGRLLSPAACRAGLSPNQRSLAGFPRCMKRKIWSTRCIGADNALCSELRSGKLPLPYAAGAASGGGEPVRFASTASRQENGREFLRQPKPQLLTGQELMFFSGTRLTLKLYAGSRLVPALFAGPPRRTTPG